MKNYSIQFTKFFGIILLKGKGRPSGSFEIQENIFKNRTQTPSAPFNEIRRDCLEH